MLFLDGPSRRGLTRIRSRLEEWWIEGCSFDIAMRAGYLGPTRTDSDGVLGQKYIHTEWGTMGGMLPQPRKRRYLVMDKEARRVQKVSLIVAETESRV